MRASKTELVKEPPSKPSEKQMTVSPSMKKENGMGGTSWKMVGRKCIRKPSEL